MEIQKLRDKKSGNLDKRLCQEFGWPSQWLLVFGDNEARRQYLQ